MSAKVISGGADVLSGGGRAKCEELLLGGI